MVVWISSPVAAGGGMSSTIMDIARSEPQATPTGDHRDDARAEELSNLKLALATFALQLDAFEMRTSRVAHGPGATAVKKVTWRQVGRVTEPGRYMFRFGWLTIAAEDLAVWEQLPNAAFTLIRTASEIEEYRLGAFDLRKDLALGEK
jgi:hypothetical protein